MHLFSGYKAAMGQALSAYSGPPPMMLRMLQLCVRNPGITQQTLADVTGRDKAQIARLIKVLLEEELLERKPHPQDKRSHSLWPTVAGHAALLMFEKAQTRVAAQLFGELDPAQLKEITEQWRDMHTRLGQMLKSDSDGSGP